MTEQEIKYRTKGESAMDKVQVMTEFCMDDEATLYNIEYILLPKWHLDLAEAELANANGCIEDIVAPLREKIAKAERRLEKAKKMMNERCE